MVIHQNINRRCSDAFLHILVSFLPQITPSVTSIYYDIWHIITPLFMPITLYSMKKMPMWALLFLSLIF